MVAAGGPRSHIHDRALGWAGLQSLAVHPHPTAHPAAHRAELPPQSTDDDIRAHTADRGAQAGKAQAQPPPFPLSSNRPPCGKHVRERGSIGLLRGQDRRLLRQNLVMHTGV
jgi:hypothetical protein